MDTKLTLKLDDTVIKRVKKYASLNNISLSSLVEDYFKNLINTTTTDKNNRELNKIDPVIKSFTGILKDSNYTDYKNEITEYLESKYLQK